METAGFVSRALFLWVQPIVRAGFHRPLQADDALPLPQRLRPDNIRDRFELLWAEERRRAAAQSTNASLLAVLRKLVAGDVYAAVALQAFSVVFCKFGCVLLLRRLLQIVMAADDELRGEGFAVAFGLFALNAIEGVTSSLATAAMQRALYACAASVAQSVLWKGTTLHPALQDKFRRGDLVTLALSDFSRIVDMSSILMQGVGAPFMLVAAFVLLIVLVGPMALADVPIVIAVGFLISRIGFMQGNNFRSKMRFQGGRLSVLNEMLQSVRFTKYYVLEEHYENQMLEQRKHEESALFGMKFALALNWPIASLVPTLTVVLILPLYVAVHGELPPKEDTLAILAVARFLYLPFAFFGGFLGSLNMFISSTSRWSVLLQQTDIARCELKPTPKLVDANQADIAVRIDNKSFSWTLNKEETPTLKNIDLAIPRGELWAIVGELGSGKSSVLSAVLGCMGEASSDLADESKAPPVVTTGPTRAYVAQVPMVMNATVRDNVLFGATSETSGTPLGAKTEAQYQAALQAAALGPDLKVLPAGDMTEIGEKGITMSGGQKARVALARAVMATQPGGLVLLDDPLAAVDAHVGSHLFNECIVGALAGTTRLLVTNQLHFLHHQDVSKVLVMDNGRVAEQGTFAELTAKPESRLSKMASSIGGAKQGQAESAEEQVDHPKPDIAPAQDNAATGQLVKKETKVEGAVSWSTIFYYFKAMGGVHMFIGLSLCSWMFHLSELIPDVFLVWWQEDQFGKEQNWYLGIWLGISLGGFLCLICCRVVWVFVTCRASRVIHKNMLRRVLHCPTGFFDQTPSGRIMNRFGEDQMIIDFSTALNFEVLCICFWQVVDQVSLAIAARPLVGPFVFLFFIFFMCIREMHRRCSREMIRWWMVTKSPLFNTLEETLSGVTTIYAFGREDYFGKRFESALQRNLQWLMSRDLANLWTDQRLMFLGSMVVGTLAVLLVLTPGAGNSTFGAVALIYALQLGFSLKTVSYFLVQVEGVLASVERASEFTERLDQEPPRQLPNDAALVQAKWPGSEATLVFENVCVRYLPGMPRALDGLTMNLKAKEKVGIVGRTGSGKSTVMGALFRLFELEEGSILFGGSDIASVGIGFLRKQITIVPQDPILFAGNLRKNLDPLAVRSDDQVWSALKRCSLHDMVNGLEGGLSALVSEGGSNFSLGERQVLCLARALLRDASVLCFDEATANVDPTNDKRIQAVLNRELKECLVLTIAHRLHTVLNSDRILVLNAGKLAQLGPPAELLSSEGIFKELAAQAGISSGDLATSDPAPPTDKLTVCEV